MNENMEEKFFLCVPVLRTLRHKFKCLYGHKEENGSNYSLMPFRVWCYKLGTPVFRQILRLTFVKPLRRHQVGWGVSVCRHWLGHSEMDSEATPLLSCCVIRVIPHQKRRSPPTPHFQDMWFYHSPPPQSSWTQESTAKDFIWGTSHRPRRIMHLPIDKI